MVYDLQEITTPIFNIEAPVVQAFFFFCDHREKTSQAVEKESIVQYRVALLSDIVLRQKDDWVMRNNLWKTRVSSGKTTRRHQRREDDL